MFLSLLFFLFGNFFDSLSDVLGSLFDFVFAEFAVLGDNEAYVLNDEEENDYNIYK